MREQLTVGHEARRLSKSLEALSNQLAKSSASPQSRPRAMRSGHDSSDVDLFKLDIHKYNPNQPRDDKGRFASTGGSGVRRSGSSGIAGNPLFQPAHSPTWWPTMARDLTITGLAAGAIGITPILTVAGNRFARTIFAGIAPVAARIAQQTGASAVAVFHNMARAMGYKIPKSALRGVPIVRAGTAAAAAAAAAAAKITPAGIKNLTRGAKAKAKASKPIAGKPKRTK